MSKVLRTVGTVAAVVAISLAIPGAGSAIGMTAAQAASTAAIASAVSAAAMAGAQATAKRPTPFSQGQINNRIIGANNPQPYLIGRTYSGGLQVHDVGYGGKVGKVQNPYRFIPTVHSCCGPVESLESVQLDFVDVPLSGTNATGYYAGFFWADWQLGNRPTATALSPISGPAPDWDSSYKLSGYAAIGYSLLFDNTGEKFAGGSLPTIGAIWEGVKVYDPRLDDTYPGGSGNHRIDNEDNSWAYSRNPALHALAYAYGRYVNGVKVFGVDLSDVGSIDLASVVAWANTCDTNGWTVNGIIYEPGDKWNNLKRICEAGGAEPVLVGGTLRFDFQAPRTSLYTITKDDLADGVITGSLSKGWKNRHNTLIPRYRSEDHQWNFQQAAAVDVPAWITADGEIKSDERQWDLVTDVDQVTELAIYDLYQRREGGAIRLNCKSHMRLYEPGDCLTLGADLGVHPSGAIKAIVRSRSIDPISGVVSFEFEQETDTKHSEAVGATGIAPAATTPPTSADMDEAYSTNSEQVDNMFFIRNASVLNSRDGVDTPRDLLIATDVGADVTISVARHDWDYPGGTAIIQRETDDITALAFNTTYYVYFDDLSLADTTPTYATTTDPLEAENSIDNPSRHPLGKITTPADGGIPTSSNSASGYGQRVTADLDYVVDLSLNPDGTIKADKVGSNAIIDGAVTQSTFDEWSDTRGLPFSLTDYRYINQGGLIFTSGGDVHIHGELLAWLSYSVSGLSGGEEIGANFAITRWDGGAPGSAENLADYVTAGATTIATGLLLLKTNYDGTVTSGTVTTEKRNLTVDFIDVAPSEDGYWYAIWAKMDTATGGGSISTNSYQRMRLLEVKK